MQAFLVLVLLLRVASSLNDDGLALLSFKQSISQDPQSSLSNWNSSDQNPCSWNGVTCKDLRVVSLSVPKKKLYGFIPSSLGSISSLRHLNLRSNRLYGRLPSDLFDAKGLQSLVLFGNSLSGSLPREVGELNYLQSLDLSGNFFNGSLPDSILNCKRLRTLDLSQNNFTGPLPSNFGSAFMGSLEKLDLSFNIFSGSIPNDIGNLSSLQGTVDFSHNMFSGLIPASLGNLPEKVYIDLTHNNLTGPIPQTGALMNRGPTAFLGNPGLCGPPLKDPCSTQESPFPYLPDSNSSTNTRSSPSLLRNGRSKGLSKSVLIAIVVSDAIGICLVGLLFSYCYSRIRSCKDRNENSHKKWSKSSKKKKKECLCLGKEDSEALSENNNNNNGVEQYDLVALDGQLGFDLDELLKASAFVLGKSGIGIVYKVVLEDGLTLAVRRLGEGGSQRFREFRTEVEAIGKLKHPNIATLRAYYWSVDEKLLIYDYVPNGNLSSAIHGKPGTVPFEPLSWATRLNVMKGIGRGVLYLHEYSPKKYVHGDLKPNNILLDHNMRPHISDFGLARLATIAGAGSPVSGSDRTATTDKPPHHHHHHDVGAGPTIIPSAGPSCYVAPEAVKMVKPSQKWDIYSYGAILLELVTGRSPVVQVGPAEEVDLVRWIRMCVDEKKPLSEVLDPHLAREAEDHDNDDEIVAVIKIAMACVQTSPEKRPTMRHVCEALERLTNVSDI